MELGFDLKHLIENLFCLICDWNLSVRLKPEGEVGTAWRVVGGGSRQCLLLQNVLGRCCVASASVEFFGSPFPSWFAPGPASLVPLCCGSLDTAALGGWCLAVCVSGCGQCPNSLRVGCIWTRPGGFFKFLLATYRPIWKTRTYCDSVMLRGFGGKSGCDVRQGSLWQCGVVTWTQKRRAARTPWPGQPIWMQRVHKPFHNYPSWMPPCCLNRLFKMVPVLPMQPHWPRTVHTHKPGEVIAYHVSFCSRHFYKRVCIMYGVTFKCQECVVQ